MRLFSTAHQKKWWQQRPIDWKQDYLSTWDHPHRFHLAAILKKLRWGSLFEVGTGAGANPLAFSLVFPRVALGGCDVAEGAVRVAQEALPQGVFNVGSGDDILMSDKSADLVMTDMTLIYVDALTIKKYLKEMVRVARNYIVLCEFYHPSLWKRIMMTLQGRHTHNYPKLLDRLGCYDIQVHKMPIEVYPGARDIEYRYTITARV